ncbi:hypothetical protein IKE84_02700 [Candidatus Saccharibacteria bacterium]|nr:hypothetical protein [Candidatus Saccharibacteria bacterium]
MDEYLNIIGKARTCTKCGKTKPVEFFGTRVRENGKVQPHSQCKECRRIHRMEWRRAKGVKPRERRTEDQIRRGVKVCLTCGIEKPLEEFPKAFIKDRQKIKYFSHCRECTNAKNRKGPARIAKVSDGKNTYLVTRSEKKEIELRTGLKVCNKCGQTKSLDEFYKSKDYYHPECKKCTNKSQAESRRRRGLYKGYFENTLEKALADGHKTCKRCSKTKPLNEFSFRKDSNNYNNTCKKCKAEIAHADYHNNTEARLEMNRKYRLKNIEHIRKNKRRYGQEHKEERKIYLKKWYEENKDTVVKEYRDKNHDILMQKHISYMVERAKTDPLFRFTNSIRGLVRASFKRRGYKKNSKTYDIIGCDFKYLYTHLMVTWRENYGTEYNGEDCNIDHIYPLADAKSEKEVIKLCHYSNLQLLSSSDNIDKKDKKDWVPPKTSKAYGRIEIKNGKRILLANEA